MNRPPRLDRAVSAGLFEAVIGRGRKALRSAPLSVAWLVVLLGTSRVQQRVGPGRRRRVLARESTNLHHLRRDPHRVLLTSLLWLDGRTWSPYVPLYVLLVAPAERRLGSLRWLVTGLGAHVGATYAGQAYLRATIRRSHAPHRLVNAVDVGVSYFALGVGGALTSYVRRPWRSRVRGGAGALLVANVVVRPTFTEVGHLTAFVIGLACGVRVPDGPPYPDVKRLDAVRQAAAERRAASSGSAASFKKASCWSPPT